MPVVDNKRYEEVIAELYVVTNNNDLKTAIWALQQEKTAKKSLLIATNIYLSLRRIRKDYYLLADEQEIKQLIDVLNKTICLLTDHCKMLDPAITTFKYFPTLEVIQQRAKDALAEKNFPKVFNPINHPTGHITWIQQVPSLRASI